MRLTFLGKSTQGGGSPTLYATDRETYVVQGWRMAGKPADCVEIPELLLGYLPVDAELQASLHLTGNRWHGDGGECGTFMLSGRLVTDRDTLEQMSVPSHESCIEVGKSRKESGFAPPSGF